MIRRPSARHAVRLAAVVAPFALALACAGSGPKVLTDTPDEVAVEFPKNGDLGEATELADAACAKHGRIARFGVVKTAATPTTRVAKYRCVSPDIAATPESTLPQTTPPVASPPPGDASTATQGATEPAPTASP